MLKMSAYRAKQNKIPSNKLRPSSATDGRSAPFGVSDLRTAAITLNPSIWPVVMLR